MSRSGNGRAILGGGGGGGAAVESVSAEPLWFKTLAGNLDADSFGISPPFEAYTDGMPAPDSPDARVDPGDTTQIEILTAGVYQLTVFAFVGIPEEAPPLSIRLTVALNDDNVGPLYDLGEAVTVANHTEVAGMNLVAPVRFAIGDMIKPNLGAGGDFQVYRCLITLVRLSAS